jgi:hypothetical protein
VLLEPELIAVGLAVKEVIAGLPDVLVTVTVAVEVAEPEELVAVRV